MKKNALGKRCDLSCIHRATFLLFSLLFLFLTVAGREGFLEKTVFCATEDEILEYLDGGINLIPLKTIKRFYSLPFRGLFINILGNIAISIPVSLFFSLSFPKAKHPFIAALLAGAYLSAAAEILQLIFMCGVLDIDDLLLNSAGSAIGAASGLLFQKFFENE